MLVFSFLIGGTDWSCVQLLSVEILQVRQDAQAERKRCLDYEVRVSRSEQKACLSEAYVIKSSPEADSRAVVDCVGGLSYFPNLSYKVFIGSKFVKILHR